MPHRHLFVITLVASLLLHWAGLFGLPQIDLDAPRDTELPPPLEAQLVPAPVKTVVKAPPPTPKRIRPKVATSTTSIPAPSVATESVEPIPPPPSTTSPTEATPSAALPAATYPYGHVSLRYDLYYGDGEALVGEVQHEWKLEGGRYLVQARIEAVGLAALFFGKDYVQRSEGSLGPEGLLPDKYTFNQSREEEEGVDFNWAQTRLNMRRGAKATEAPLRLGTQDLLSLLHQLYFMQPLQQRNVIYVATPRRLQTHIVELIGEEDLRLPAGPIRSLHVKSTDSDGALLELWLDRDRSLLPVRVHSVNRKGVVLDYKLRSMSVDVAKN